MLAGLYLVAPPPQLIAYVRGGDIWTCDLQGKGQKLVAKKGVHPCWSPDHKKICFVRDASLVVVDLSTHKERTIWKTAKQTELGLPTWGPRYALARWDSEKPTPNLGDSIVFQSSWMGKDLLQITSSSKRPDDANFVNMPIAVEVEAPTWSRDGKSLALAINGDVWIDYQEDNGWTARRLVACADYDFATGRASMEIEYARQLSWSPDSKQLAFVKRRVGGMSIRELWIADVKAEPYSRSVTRVRRISESVAWASFTADGRSLVCDFTDGSTQGLYLYGLQTKRWTLMVPDGEEPAA